MDKTPKERIVFDEGVYYGGEGSEISIEDITSREGGTRVICRVGCAWGFHHRPRT